MHTQFRNLEVKRAMAGQTAGATAMEPGLIEAQYERGSASKN